VSEPRIESVDRLYARSLYELAESAGAVDEVSEQAQQVRDLLRDEPGLQQLFNSRILTTEQLAGSLERMFSGKLHDAFYRFLMVVNRKHRLPRLRSILRAFAELIDEIRGIIDVQAYVAQALPDDRAAGVSDRIGQAMNKQVRLHQTVDESLIGGIKLKVGDRLIDGSVATQLRLIERRLTTAGREKAKVQAQAM